MKCGRNDAPLILPRARCNEVRKKSMRFFCKNYHLVVQMACSISSVLQGPWHTPRLTNLFFISPGWHELCCKYYKASALVYWTFERRFLIGVLM